MAWSTVGSVTVASPGMMGWEDFELPTSPASDVYNLDYLPDSTIPINWARVGFYFVAVIVDGERVTTSTLTMPGRTAEGNRVRMLLDYSGLVSDPLLAGRITGYEVLFQLVPYAPPGRVRLRRLV